MTIRIHPILSVLGLLILGTLPFGASALPIPTEEELATGDSAFEVTDGVIAGPERALVFLLEPGGLVARSAATGQIAWDSGLPAKPLDFYGNNLVAFSVEPDAPRGRLLFIDPATGRPGDEIEIDFPARVRPLLADAPNQRFSIRAWRDGNDVLLDWNYLSMPLRGIPVDGTGMPTPPSGGLVPQAMEPAVGSDRRTQVGGAIRIDVLERSATAVAAGGLSAPTFEPLIEGPDSARAAASAERTFQARDGRHRLVSRQISSETWDRYRWTVAEPGGESLGNLQLPLAYAPFFVSDSRLLYIAPPMILRDENGGFEVLPLRITALELASGKEAWSAALLDPTYRGELPP